MGYAERANPNSFYNRKRRIVTSVPEEIPVPEENQFIEPAHVPTFWERVISFLRRLFQIQSERG